MPVFLVISIFTVVHGAADLDDPALFFGGLVGLYTVASRSSRTTSYLVAGLTAAGIAGATVASGDTPFVTVALNFVVFATAWILGDSVRVRRAYTAELEQRASRLEQQREEEAERAAAGERVRTLGSCTTSWPTT